MSDRSRGKSDPSRAPSTWGPVKAFNIGRLDEPAPEHDLAVTLVADIDPSTGKARKAFLTPEACIRERSDRRDGLISYARQQAKASEGHTLGEQASVLADALERNHPNLANPVFFDEVRRRLVGAVLEWLDRHPGSQVSVYTLVASKWSFSDAALAQFEPKKLLAKIMARLDDAGLAGFSGWCICFVDNERDPTMGRFQPHIHVLVVGEKRNAFERLRELGMFKGGKGAPIRSPIVENPVLNLARQISYLWKIYCPERPSFASETGGKRRNQKPHRLSAGLHEQMLLLLASSRFADVVRLHGIEIVDGRLELKPTK